jgi:hypothetical protein
MKFLHRLLPVLISILFILQGWILLGFGEQWPFKNLVKSWPILSGMFVLFSLPIVYFIVYKAYVQPIQNLNQSIFPALWRESMKNQISLRPIRGVKGWIMWYHFSSKSLQILRVFKQELRDGRKLRSEVEIASEIQKNSIAGDESLLSISRYCYRCCSGFWSRMR